MSQTVEAQRAIIEGGFTQKPGTIYEVRARLVVPSKATVLEAPNAKLALRGYWSADKGYVPFGLAPIPTGPDNQFALEVQPDPEDDPNIVYMVRPRNIILEDQKVFRRYSPWGWGPGDPNNAIDQEYGKRHFVSGRPFDFEAMWARVGRR